MLDRKSKEVSDKLGNRRFLSLRRNLETVGAEMILRTRATLDVMWAGFYSLFGIPLLAAFILKAPITRGTLFPPLPSKPRYQPGWGFSLFQWKLHEALEHLRKEQEEAWKLEVGERKRTATWKAGCRLGKEFGWFRCCPGAGHGDFLISRSRMWGLNSEPGILMPASSTGCAALGRPRSSHSSF